MYSCGHFRSGVAAPIALILPHSYVTYPALAIAKNVSRMCLEKYAETGVSDTFRVTTQDMGRVLQKISEAPIPPRVVVERGLPRVESTIPVEGLFSPSEALHSTDFRSLLHQASLNLTRADSLPEVTIYGVPGEKLPPLLEQHTVIEQELLVEEAILLTLTDNFHLMTLASPMSLRHASSVHSLLEVDDQEMIMQEEVAKD